MNIVLKLRAGHQAATDELLNEAADEIERLRVALHAVAYSALDAAGLPYKQRKQYGVEAERSTAQEGRRAKERADMKRQRVELTDHYIKVLLTKRGPLRFGDVTNDMVKLKRDQMIAARLAQRMEHAAAEQLGTQ